MSDPNTSAEIGRRDFARLALGMDDARPVLEQAAAYDPQRLDVARALVVQADDPDQERLQQPLPPDDVTGVPRAVRGERGAVVRGALDEAVRLEAVKQARHGGSRDAQVPGQRGGVDRVAAPGEHEDRTQGVLCGGAGDESATRARRAPIVHEPPHAGARAGRISRT